MKSNLNLDNDTVNVSLIMTTLKIGTFLALLNETIINVALSKLMAVFSVSANSAQWLTSGYMLVMGIFVPVTAYLIERLSTRKLYLSAMSVFLLGTVLAACAQNFPMLLGARLIQALGTGVLLPLMMNTVMVLNPPNKRGSAMGSALLIVLFAPAIGPTYAGLVIQMLDWRWIFILLIPLAVFSILFGWLFLKNVTQTVIMKLDFGSVLLSTIGFGALLYGINSLCTEDFSKITGLSILLVGIAALTMFIFRQLQIPNPLLNVRVFGFPIFSLGILLITITYMILFANFVLMPMFIEKILGYSIFQAGLAVLPGGILGAILPPILGKVYDRFGPRVIVPLGFGIMAIANFSISHLTSTASIISPIIYYCLVIIGLATLLTASQTNSLNQLPHEYYSHGTATMNTMMLIGSALGSSVFIAIMSLKQRQSLLVDVNQITAINNGISYAYLIVSGLAVIGFILSLFFHKKSLLYTLNHTRGERNPA